MPLGPAQGPRNGIGAQRFPQDAQPVVGKKFQRDANARGIDAARAGRDFEPAADGAQPPRPPSNYTRAEPVYTPTARASLVERDNPEEFLQFHWNPTTYKISKTATWKDTEVVGGTATLDYTGCGVTKVEFELLLNELGQHGDRLNQYSVESSLQWLFERTRPRPSHMASAKRRLFTQGRPWLNVQDPAAGVKPPILVLFGLSFPFTCVLETLEVETIFQGRYAGPIPRTDATKSQRSRFQRQTQDGIQESAFVKRALAQITLKEFVGSPAAGEE